MTVARLRVGLQSGSEIVQNGEGDGDVIEERCYLHAACDHERDHTPRAGDCGGTDKLCCCLWVSFDGSCAIQEFADVVLVIEELADASPNLTACSRLFPRAIW